MLPLVEPLPPCPACLETQLRPLHVNRNRHAIAEGAFFAVLGCITCGLVFAAPRPTPDRLAEFYDRHTEEGWGIRPQADAAAVEEWRLSKLAGSRRKLAWVPAMFPGSPADRRALDFGCGAGVLLDVLKEHGWQTRGIEPASFGEVAAMRHQMLPDLPSTPEFDLVLLHHVLEHVLEPAAILRRLRHSTKPGGVIFVAVPSVDLLPSHGDFRYTCNPIHLNGFTAAALRNVFRISGWEPIDTSLEAPKRLIGIARRAAPVPPDRGALDHAIDALRKYGRQLDADGRFQAGVEPASR